MNLFTSLATMSTITFFSRVLGFIRDAILARIFGTSMESDAFLVAFKIPNMLRRIFAEGAFSQVFVPILSKYRSQKNQSAVREFIAHIAGSLILVLVLITVVGILISPWIIMITAPGFKNIPEKFALTNILLRILFPYIFLISLVSLVSAVLNTWNRFLVPTFAPLFLNTSMIVSALFLTFFFHPPAMVLAWSVLVGGIFQLAYQLPFLKKIGMFVVPRINFRDAGVLCLLKKIGPAIIGVSVNQISLIANTIFASFLIPGSISWIYYADRIMEFPSGLLGAALGTVLLPSLSSSIAQGNRIEYSSLLDWGLRLCFLLALPSAAAMAILSYPLTIVLFQYGKFSSFDALMTQYALIAYSFGLVGFVLVKVLSAGFYSLQDIKIPVRIALITLFMTQLMNIMFIGPLKHAGLSLSISLASYLNAGLLYWQLRRQKLFYSRSEWLVFFYRLILSVIVMSMTLIVLLSLAPDWTQGTMSYRLLRLISMIIIGILVYFTTLWLVGFRWNHFTQMIIVQKTPLSEKEQCDDR